VTDRHDRIGVLVLATKAPCTPVGGGNVSLDALLRALPDHGVDVRVLALSAGSAPATTAPYPARQVPVSRSRRALDSLLHAASMPLPVARYRCPRLVMAFSDEIRAGEPDVIHLEQPHLGWLLSTLDHRRPVVLRAQNVESRLLAQLATVRAGPVAWLQRREARRLADFEAGVCRRADVVAAISALDARHLADLSPSARVVELPAAWGRSLPPAGGRLAGERPFLCLGAFDWGPNRDGVEWLLRAVWPRLARRVPGATLHLAGPGSDRLAGASVDRIFRHGRVEDAAALYDPRAVVLIPLRVGSGVRLRLLEAWWAGVPAAVTPVAAEGLLQGDADGAVVAATAAELADVAARLANDPSLRTRVVDAGRRRLRAHEACRVAGLAREIYLDAIERASGRSRETTPWAGTPSGAEMPRALGPSTRRAMIGTRSLCEPHDPPS
jgi:polysaccharide biosynthesis protein PslH